MAISGPTPPFSPDDTSAVIAGSFMVGLDTTIFSHRLGMLIDGFHRSGGWRAVITRMKDPSGDNWLFQSATGIIDPCPNPPPCFCSGVRSQA